MNMLAADVALLPFSLRCVFVLIDDGVWPLVYKRINEATSGSRHVDLSLR